jgi:hypothetical protein
MDASEEREQANDIKQSHRTADAVDDNDSF